MKRGIIADYIRAHVKRPKQLPRSHSWVHDRALRFYIRKCCPMGLLKEARSHEPDAEDHFKPLPEGFTARRIMAFGEWWDQFEDPELAVKALWG